MTKNWQYKMLEKIEKYLENENKIQFAILVGSLTDKLIKVDDFSDIDLKIGISGENINNFYTNLDWIEQLGKVFAYEKLGDIDNFVIRVCLENFERIDFNFINISENDFHINIPGGNYKILKNNFGNLENYFNFEQIYKGINKDWLLEFQNNFWYKATLVLVKLKRNDFLIAYHMLLDLQKDCLVLKMIERDELFKTNIHRFGGYGNSFIGELFQKQITENLENEILKSVIKVTEIFETLSKELNGFSREKEFKQILLDLNLI